MQKLCCARTRQHPLPVWSHKFVLSSLTHFSTNSHPFLVGYVSRYGNGHHYIPQGSRRSHQDSESPMDHTWFTQAYIKTAIEEHHKLYDSYDCLNDHGTCYTLLDSLDGTFKMYIEACLPNDFCFLLI